MEVDPLLPERLRAETGVMRAERRVYDAAWSALTTWVPRVAARTLGTLTAAAEPPAPDPHAALAEAALWQELVDGGLVAAVTQVVEDRYGLADAVFERTTKVAEYLDGVRNRLSNVPDETFAKITAVMDDGLRAGLSIPELRDQVADELATDLGGPANAWRSRATVIARTEALAACNAGDQMAREQLAAGSGMATDKLWLATLDARTRPDHFRADGQRVPLDQPFEVGGERMMFPGDPTASAGQTVNCRCTTIELDRDDPSPTDLGRGGKQQQGEDEVQRRAAIGQTRAADNGGRPVTASGQEVTMGETPWSGPLAMIDTDTGDGRRFAADSLSNRDLPLPLMFVSESSFGHDGAVTVGRIDTIEYRDGGQPWGTGAFFDTEDPDISEELKAAVQDAKYLSGQKVIGPSVDLDDVTADMVDAETGEPIDDEGWIEIIFGEAEEPEMVYLISEGRISGATLVSIPAFAELMGQWTIGETETVAASAQFKVNSSWSSTPIAPRDTGWDAAAADRQVSSWAGIDADDAGSKAWTKYGKAFLYRDDEADPNTKAAYKLPICDVSDGELRVVYAGTSAAAGRLDSADIGASDTDSIKSAINTLYGRFRDEFDDDTIKSPFEEAALLAAGVPEPYRAGWFADPKLETVTPLTVTKDGRVFGHAAAWGTCHVGVGNSCVTPPHSASEYAYFHVGEISLDNGESMAVGTLTVGAGHADVRLGYRPATEHYDNAATAVAYVRAYEDAHGVAVAGQVIHSATADQVEKLKAHPPSGDWRRIGGAMELIGVLAVNRPGFPVTRTRESAGRQTALVAAAPVPRSTKPRARQMIEEAVTAALDAYRAREDRARRVAAARGRINAVRVERALNRIGRE